MRKLDQSIPLKLLRAREVVMDRFRPHLNAAGVTEQQWRVIRALAETGSMDIGALARLACLLVPSLSRIVRDLTAQGIVTRTVARDDRRQVIVALTPVGKRLFERMADESRLIYGKLESDLGPALCRRMMRDLDQLIAQLEKCDEVITSQSHVVDGSPARRAGKAA